MIKYLAFILLTMFVTATSAGGVSICDQVCGKWYAPENNLVIQIYKDGDQFRAKIISFKCDKPGETLENCLDISNPDPSLRSRKIVGTNVLSDLRYNAGTKSWEGGMIYDSHNGRYWNASARMDNDGTLKVKGYWHFKFIGRTMTFKRYNDANELAQNGKATQP